MRGIRGLERASSLISLCGVEPVPYAAVKVDSTDVFVIEVFDDSSQVCVDVVQPHGTPHCRMPS
ncbi:hypothetical protein DPMN_088537 [Dreissena polymorpha]|uniref:Uncharacterized protein n=1 Tax=Dreissena polymorpha TaxID=45954 RepID=A0A9D4QX69_DREPO|nr:hypothetical protein DPMN_088537 [Dreissena polymorpha]